ncbi:hypothetical protein TNCV_746601 [Trichonephila clavipes]|nr:hypothetical protein TNCV_746601 [Trichonephila clavipes]
MNFVILDKNVNYFDRLRATGSPFLFYKHSKAEIGIWSNLTDISFSSEVDDTLRFELMLYIFQIVTEILTVRMIGERRQAHRLRRNVQRRQIRRGILREERG